MYTNFFRITARYFWRNKTYSTLNFLCLTFGLTCAIISVLYIMNIFSYDKFHKNYNHLYSVEAWMTFFNGDRFPKSYLSASLNEVLKEHVPEIEESTRIVRQDNDFVKDDKTFTENGICADTNFFNIFSFPLIQGDPLKVLNDINSIVISERMARIFFDNTKCMGNTLILKEGNRQKAFKVTGVLRNLPTQSTLQFDFVIPFSRFLADNSWAMGTGATSNQLYIVLKDKIDYKLVNDKIKDLIRHQETTLNQELFLFPLKEKMLYSYAGGKRIWGGMQNVIIVGSIGFGILMMACFNFINLAMAVNMRRYREAVIKKVVGSRKSTIVIQFLSETFLLTLVSLITAIIMVWVLIPSFNSMFGQDIQLRFSDLKVLLFFLAVTLFTSLASGAFPAFYLASSNHVDVLKQKITKHSFNFFRQSFIVFQFTIPIVLLILTMIIKVQDDYLHNFNPGFDKDRMIILDNSHNIQRQAESVKTELLKIPGIEAVSFTNCIPTRGATVSDKIRWDGKDATEKSLFWCINSDFDYNKVIDIRMKKGRYFDASFSADSGNYVINDVAAEVMKNKNPLGSSLILNGKKGTIVGVISDFHTIDLAGPFVPTIIHISPSDRKAILIRFSSGTYASLIDKIEKIYKHYDPETPFRPKLFSDLPIYSSLPGFSNLSTPSNLIGLSSFIALILACLGFFGLASFYADSRTKEIGIRKTNGATTLSIMKLLLAGYTKWLMIASFIAIPIASLLGKIFLDRFHFHTSLPLWTFVASPLIACIVAFSTVGLRTWKASNQNPVKSLKYE